MNMINYAKLFDPTTNPAQAKKEIKKWKENVLAVHEPRQGERERQLSAVYESSDSIRRRHESELDQWRQNQDRDRALIESIRSTWGLTDRDNVQIFIVPKGQNRIQPGSFITRPTTSPRAEELTRFISSNRTQIRELEIGIQAEELTDDERSARINALRNTIRTNERALQRERARIATLPRSGFIIVERDS